MRNTTVAFFALLSASAAAASACGSVSPAQSSGTASSGGSGGSITTTETTTTTTVTDAGSDVDNGMVSTNYPAPHPAPPQVVYGGGAVLQNPKLVPVFFPSDAFQTQLTDFVSKIGGTSYWTAVTSEYGVSAATSLPAVVLTETAPTTIDDSDIQKWLAGKINSNDPAWPQPDADTLYILHYPSTTTITLQGGFQGTSKSCQDFGGYHNSVTLDSAHGGADVAYAVVPRCQSFGNLTGIDAVTGAESHEIIEAATDPYPMNNPAYGQVDNAHLYWLFALGGGETGDMCAQFPGVFTKFSELAYTVQRSWSNAAAKAGHDPCQPALAGEVYFNSAPVLNDNVSIMGAGTMKGVKIPVGSSKVVDLDLFSDGDTGGPWKVAVKDFGALVGLGNTMTFSLDKSQGQNGEKLHLTINVTKASQFGAGIFLVTSTLGARQNWWIGLVGN